jgi:hypothetical protein
VKGGNACAEGRRSATGCDMGREGRRLAVNLVRTDDGESGHADLLRVTFLDDTHASETSAVSRVLLLDLLEEVQVDVVDDLEVAGEKPLEKADAPLLQSFGKYSVVGVGEGLREEASVTV